MALQAENGFGIIEVLVSALLVVVLSLSLFAAIDAAGRTADSNKDRTAASNLASADQERLRSMTIAELIALPDTPEPRTVLEGGRNYTVRSQAAYVLGKAEDTACASNENAPRHLRITSTVTWADMRNVQPVTQDSLRAIPAGSTPGKGSAAIRLTDRDGKGLADVPVSLTGTSNQGPVSTNAAGCVVFGFIPAGEYTVSFGQSGHVEAQLPSRSLVEHPVVVASNAIASKQFEYDKAGTVTTTFKTTTTGGGSSVTNYPFSGQESNSGAFGFTVGNAALGTPGYRAFAPGGASSSSTGATLYPFAITAPATSNYEVWAGECIGAKPPGGANAPISTANVDRGTASGVDVRLPRVVLEIRRKTSTGTTENVPNGTPAWLRATSSGCTTYVKSTVNGGFARFSVPYGNYVLCAQWADGAVNRQTQTFPTTFTSDNQNGKRFASVEPVSGGEALKVVPVLPYGGSAGVAGCPTS